MIIRDKKKKRSQDQQAGLSEVRVFMKLIWLTWKRKMFCCWPRRLTWSTELFRCPLGRFVSSRHTRHAISDRLADRDNLLAVLLRDSRCSKWFIWSRAETVPDWETFSVYGDCCWRDYFFGVQIMTETIFLQYRDDLLRVQTVAERIS